MAEFRRYLWKRVMTIGLDAKGGTEHSLSACVQNRMNFNMLNFLKQFFQIKASNGPRQPEILSNTWLMLMPILKLTGENSELKKNSAIDFSAMDLSSFCILTESQLIYRRACVVSLVNMSVPKAVSLNQRNQNLRLIAPYSREVYQPQGSPWCLRTFSFASVLINLCEWRHILYDLRYSVFYLNQIWGVHLFLFQIVMSHRTLPGDKNIFYKFCPIDNHVCATSSFITMQQVFFLFVLLFILSLFLCFCFL